MRRTFKGEKSQAVGCSVSGDMTLQSLPSWTGIEESFQKIYTFTFFLPNVSETGLFE